MFSMLINIKYEYLEKEQDDILLFLTEKLPELNGILNTLSDDKGFFTMRTESEEGTESEETEFKEIFIAMKSALSDKYSNLILYIWDD
jgi:hypothetical protein